MRELVNFMKELLLLKPETNNAVGLTGLKKRPARVIAKPKKPQRQELKISDLMRRA